MYEIWTKEVQIYEFKIRYKMIKTLKKILNYQNFKITQGCCTFKTSG